MTAAKQRNSGFTIIELILVLVIISILAALIAFSYSGVRSRDRDSTRQEHISTIQSHLEVYYAEHSQYPTLAQLNDADWRSENLSRLDGSALQNPGWKSGGNCAEDGRAVLIAQPAENCYAYSPASSDGEACDNDNKPCAHYTLTTPLESGEEYIRTSLN
jgi:general secretion pathway protein G